MCQHVCRCSHGDLSLKQLVVDVGLVRNCSDAMENIRTGLELWMLRGVGGIFESAPLRSRRLFDTGTSDSKPGKLNLRSFSADL